MLHKLHATEHKVNIILLRRESDLKWHKLGKENFKSV